MSMPRCPMKGDQPMSHSADALPAGIVVHRDLAYVSGGHHARCLICICRPEPAPCR